MNGGYHMPTTKSTLFTVSKDEWDTKEGTGKSWRMQWNGKRAEVTSNSDKVKPIAIAIIKLHLSEGAVSQSVGWNNFFKFRNNFLKAFWVNF